MTLTPAYGRDYTSKAKVQAALDSDNDFIINDITSRWDGKPVNRQQLAEEGKTTIMVRYNKLRKIGQFKVKP